MHTERAAAGYILAMQGIRGAGFWGCLAAMLLASLALAQSDEREAPPSAEEIQERIDALPEDRQAAREAYQQALSELERASSLRDRTAGFQRDASEAPGRLEAISAELANPQSEPAPEVPEDATLAQLEQGQAQASASLDAARNLVTDLQAEVTRRQDRRSEIPAAIVQAQGQLEAIDESLAAPPEEVSSALSDAQRVLRLAQREVIVAEIDALNAELASYDARTDLLPARRDRAARRVEGAEQLLAAWQSLVNERRSEDARQAARDAERLRRQAAEQHPVLQAFAEENQRLAELRTGPDSVPQRITAANERMAAASAQLADINERYATSRRRVEASGLNRATGLLLRRQYDDLPDSGQLRRRVLATRRELENAEFMLFERREEREGTTDIDRVTNSLLAEIGPQATEGGVAAQVARELATRRRDLRAELVSDAARYSEVLFELHVVTQDLRDSASQYESFVRERILWVRSFATQRLPTPAEYAEAAAWFVNPDEWTYIAVQLRTDPLRRGWVVAMGISALFLVFALALGSRKMLKRCAARIQRFETDTIWQTVLALICSLLTVLPVPFLMGWIGWVLARPPEQSLVALAIGAGLQFSAVQLALLLFLRTLVKRGGVAERHFRWPSEALALVHRYLTLLTPIVVPATLTTYAVDFRSDETASASLGRTAFSVSMLVLAFALYRTLHPAGDWIRPMLKRRPDGWLNRLRYGWFAAAVALPLVLIGLSWAGYYYTARELRESISETTWLAILVGLGNALLMRWLYLARRRVAYEDAKRRRDEAIAREREAQEEAAPEQATPSIEEDKLDLPAISQQTRQLFRLAMVLAAVIGLAAIWAETLPALRILDRVELYPRLQIIDEMESRAGASAEFSSGSGSTAPQTDPSGAADPGGTTGGAPTMGMPGMGMPSGGVGAASPGGSSATSISLADVGQAIIVLIATFFAFRNVPALAEIMILQRLPLDSGSRYALSTVLRYLIAIVGSAMAFGALEIGWSNVQWLAAALTFGLAFGLQEIFANFVSGLIILWERPFRIGDTVTVGPVSGTVSRIRMRATTITDWDRKELVIPNKTFITGEVINWTLSDATLRLTIPVGVSYGAEVKLVERSLLEVAQAQEIVLDDPKPYVVFAGFGDSTLNFEIRVFIPHIDHLLTVKTDMHMRITELFRERGIEIAFPQRDLHVRSVDEGLTDLVRRADSETDRS